MSRRAAADRFGIAASTAVKWVRRWRDTGSKAPRPQGRDKRSDLIEAHAKENLGLVAATHDITLQQAGGPPLYKYFNVAIAEVTQAVEAARTQRAAAQASRVGAVRPLSSSEIAALRLKKGQVKPA